MVKKFIHKHRRNVQKFAISFLRILSPGRKEPRVENETKVISICKNVILKEDTSLSISPISVKRIIKNDRMGIKITIKQGIINISSKDFPYKNSISGRGLEFILSMFDNEIERRVDVDDKDVDNTYNEFMCFALKEMLNNIRK